VAVGYSLVAEATKQERQGKKQVVSVEVKRDGELVASGDFICFVPVKHVFD
jgi:acyl-coenzyme A thioesterase PaaI-like protein